MDTGCSLEVLPGAMDDWDFRVQIKPLLSDIIMKTVAKYLNSHRLFLYFCFHNSRQFFPCFLFRSSFVLYFWWGLSLTLFTSNKLKHFLEKFNAVYKFHRTLKHNACSIL